jgi:hypothetical protein
MTSSNPTRCLLKNRLIAFFAAVLIALGLAFQWTELLFMRLFGHNAWLFDTLFGEIWNIISLSPSAMQWDQNLHCWPLLLVITGAAILFSRSRNKLPN